MSSTPLIFSLHKIGVIKFGEFILKSGETSKIYLDLRKIISYPDILRSVAEALWKKIHYQSFDVICGVPYTALPIATCMSLMHNLPMVMRRKEPKNYGTKQQIEGAFTPKQRCLIIEDVVTSGTSILETATDLENAGLVIQDVVTLINRDQGGKENLAKRHITLHAALTLDEILRQLRASHLLSKSESVIVDELLAERT